MSTNIPEFMSAIVLTEYRIPSITAYNRLEAVPRAANFDRSLKAEVRDPLWMLTRQWQFGEFQGEDAASPVTAQILAEHTSIDRVGFPNRIFAYDQKLPLEPIVEREQIGPSLSLAVQMGRYFLRLMRAENLDPHLPLFIVKYRFEYDIDQNDYEGRQLFEAVKDVLFDGFELLSDIRTPDGASTRFEVWMTAAGITGSDEDRFRSIADDFEKWSRRIYSQPETSDSAWLPSQLEYRFSVASGFEEQQQQRVLTANQYFEGRVDWYSFDLDSRQRLAFDGKLPGAAAENLVSFIPAPIAFKGMPHPRFWMMEENQTDFGKIDTSATGLLHLMLAEFGLIYSNDWFMLPYPLLINTLCEVKGLVITDVFNQHTLIRPANRGRESNWHRWAMFRHAVLDQNSDTNFFYLAPSIAKSLEGQPLEQVNFLRDEMANLVWAIEAVVPSHSGKGVSGNEMAMSDNLPEPFVRAGEATIRYVLGTTVPDNWIPFIPVHMEGSDTEIRLQRARMPGAKGALGAMIKENPAPYYINEEEIPRAGINVQRSFQRSRWLSGETILWIGRYKEAGKGEGWSNLRFDQIVDLPPLES